MTKDQIETKLKKDGLKKNSKSIQDYERSKELLVRGPMSADEYSFRIKVITMYLNI